MLARGPCVRDDHEWREACKLLLPRFISWALCEVCVPCVKLSKGALEHDAVDECLRRQLLAAEEDSLPLGGGKQTGCPDEGHITALQEAAEGRQISILLAIFQRL